MRKLDTMSSGPFSEFQTSWWSHTFFWDALYIVNVFLFGIIKNERTVLEASEGCVCCGAVIKLCNVPTKWEHLDEVQLALRNCTETDSSPSQSITAINTTVIITPSLFSHTRFVNVTHLLSCFSAAEFGCQQTRMSSLFISSPPQHVSQPWRGERHWSNTARVKKDRNENRMVPCDRPDLNVVMEKGYEGTWRWRALMWELLLERFGLNPCIESEWLLFRCGSLAHSFFLTFFVCVWTVDTRHQDNPLWSIIPREVQFGCPYNTASHHSLSVFVCMSRLLVLVLNCIKANSGGFFFF